jgi:hypothetical protein
MKFMDNKSEFIAVRATPQDKERIEKLRITPGGIILSKSDVIRVAIKEKAERDLEEEE